MAIPILGWHGLNAQHETLEKYREMAAAGFTYNLSGWPDVAAALRALDLAGQAGLKQFVHVKGLMDSPGQVVGAIKHHPALGGYNLTDEPAADQFEKLGQLVRQIQSLDDQHPCYINLFPTYAAPGSQLGAPTYQDYLDLFLQHVPVEFVSFDHYPIMEKSLRKDFFLNLELVAATCRRAGNPFWAFALCTAHKPYPVPTLGHLRLQQYSNLAYGAQGLQYFTYLTPTPGTWDFHDGPIETDGRKTAVYDLVRQFNQELRNVLWVFEGAAVESVGHTGTKIPLGTQPYTPAEPIRRVELGGEGAVVALLANQDRRHLMIVNRDFANPGELVVEWNPQAPIRQVDNAGRVCELPGASLARALEPGQACILSWV